MNLYKIDVRVELYIVACDRDDACDGADDALKELVGESTVTLRVTDPGEPEACDAAMVDSTIVPHVSQNRIVQWVGNETVGSLLARGVIEGSSSR